MCTRRPWLQDMQTSCAVWSHSTVHKWNRVLPIDGGWQGHNDLLVQVASSKTSQYRPRIVFLPISDDQICIPEVNNSQGPVLYCKSWWWRHPSWEPGVQHSSHSHTCAQLVIKITEIQTHFRVQISESQNMSLQGSRVFVMNKFVT